MLIVGALPDGCRRTEGRLSPTPAAKGYKLPTLKQKAARIVWNQEKIRNNMLKRKGGFKGDRGEFLRNKYVARQIFTG